VVNLQKRKNALTQGPVALPAGGCQSTLDIIAQYRLPQYIVEAAVGGTLEKPALTLRSEPALEQADILALLLFGKPVNALGSEEKVSLQQQALQVTGGYVAAQIGESVSQALGLEDLGIDLRQVDLTGGRVGFGRYLGPKTYISASQDLSGKAGHEVSVDYYLSSQWKLNTSSSTGGSTGDDNAASITWEKRY
jgi:translocation and assembly module TamB